MKFADITAYCARPVGIESVPASNKIHIDLCYGMDSFL